MIQPFSHSARPLHLGALSQSPSSLTHLTPLNVLGIRYSIAPANKNDWVKSVPIVDGSGGVSRVFSAFVL